MRRSTCTLLAPGLLAWLGLWLGRPNPWFDGHPALVVLGVACLVTLARRSLAAAAVTLFAGHAALLTWIVTALWTPVGPAWATIAWIVVAAFASAFPWLALVAARRCNRRGAPWIATLPPAWTLGEILRAELPYGFDWPSLGYAVADTALSSCLGLLGVHGTSGLLIALACLLARLTRRFARAERHAAHSTRRFAHAERRALLLVLLLLGASVLLRPDPPDRPPLRVALIQADDHDLAWTEQLPEPLLRQLDLVVGPEGLLKDPEVVPFRGAALISGSVCPLRGDCRANRVDHRDAAGTLVHARNKSILVPWYEIEFLAGVGDRPPLTESLRIADTRIATAICYEIAHAGAMRAALADGPELLLNLTSDLWQDTDLAARQQTEIAQARAAEFGLPVVRASNRYFSSVFSRTGVELFASGPSPDQTILVTTVTPTPPQTLRGRFPLCTEFILVVGCLILLLIHSKGTLRQQRSAPLAHSRDDHD